MRPAPSVMFEEQNGGGAERERLRALGCAPAAAKAGFFASPRKPPARARVVLYSGSVDASPPHQLVMGVVCGQQQCAEKSVAVQEVMGHVACD